MERFLLDPSGSVERCEVIGSESVTLLQDDDSVLLVDSALLVTLTTLWAEVRMIEVPSFQEYAVALQDALQASFESVSAWVSVVVLILSPILRLAAALGKAVWPHVVNATTSFVRFQTSLSPTTLLAEVAAITVAILLILLRRLIVRRRYIPRAQRSVRLFRARMNRRYLAFTAAVETNFKLSARVFPHVMYWVATGLFTWLAPELAGRLREKLWVCVTVSWPALYALYLVLCIRGQGSGEGGARRNSVGSRNRRASEVAAAAAVRAPSTKSPTSPEGGSRVALVTPRDVDRVLMYWVVFTMATCSAVLAQYIPFAAPVISTLTPPVVRTAAFFCVVWMHLPGPGSGLQVVYYLLEPLVHKYVKDLRTPQGMSEDVLGPLQHVLVFLRVVTKERAQLIADSVADSWMLLPTPAFIFTPGFLTNLGCLYAGLVVPSLNSIKTLGRRSQTNILGQWSSEANPAGGARVRWLTYWVAYGLWWHVSLLFSGILRILPFSRHAELVLLLWLQVPIFRGAGRIFDIAEGFLVRWTSPTAAGPGAAAFVSQNGG